MKNILLTGISGGIGQEIAKNLVSDGYFVHGIYNDREKEAKRIEQELKSVKLYKIDLSKRDQVLGLVSTLKDIKLNGLINNAGVFYDDPLSNQDLSVWDKTLEINLTTPMILVRGLADNFEKGASIVNISSIYGTRVMANDSLSYTASKSALASLTRALSVSFAGRQIRVNGVAPGPVNTPINSAMTEEAKKEIISQTPLREYCSPKYIADVVSFLMSEKAYWINGEVIVADGGQTNFHSFFSV